jgi:hypothetical protein
MLGAAAAAAALGVAAEGKSLETLADLPPRGERPAAA